MLCTKCNTENLADAVFCAECGTRLDLKCPSCAVANPRGSKFCRKCGTALETHAIGDRQSAPAPVLITYVSAPETSEGERKTVTALFADIKGSMELIEDLDPEEARAIVDPALKLMMDSVHHYGGYVAQSTGDGVFALFGAPVAHEDHPQRALLAALGMQQELKRYSDRTRAEGRLPVQARVGVNTGEVVVRSITTGEGRTEYAPIGHSTGIAARMQVLAPVGSIAATEPIRKLCEGYFVFKSLGSTKVKGVSEPVNVYEVTGLGPLRSRLQRSAARGYTKFVGRHAEMEALKRAAELAKTGHGQMVATVGEPGVGKSRLYYEFKAVSQSEWMVLEAFSVSHGQASAYMPLVDLLHSYFRITMDDDTRARREKVGGKVLMLDRALEDTLPYLFGLLGIVGGDDPVAGMDAQVRRRRTLDAIKRVLLRESLNQTLIVMFEDLHWIDDETQALLNLLADSIGTAKILLLVNYRPEYSHQWGNKTYYTQLRLDPLGPASADEMLHSLVGDGQELDPLKRLIIDKAEGNPFFMEEMVQALYEEGALLRNGAVRVVRPLDALRIPPTVQAILASRIDRLPADEKELVQTLAVIGQEFSRAVAREVVRKPDDRLNQMIDDLQLAEFVYEQPASGGVEYTFKHALTQEVAYNSILTERRKELHDRIGAALEVLYADVSDEHLGDLAHHYSRSNNISKAIDYLGRAANQATQRALYSETLGYVNRGLALLGAMPESATRARDELGLQSLKGAALMAAKGFASKEVAETFSRARELARELKDVYQEFTALQGLWGVYYTRGDAQALPVAQESMAVAQKFNDPALFQYAYYALGASLTQSGKLDEAREHLERALAYRTAPKLWGGRLLGPDPVVLSLTTLSDVLLALGYPDQSLQRSHEAANAVRGESDPFSYAMAMIFVASTHCGRGEAKRAEQLCREVMDLCDRCGFPYWLALAKRLHFLAIARQERWDEAAHMMNQQLVPTSSDDDDEMNRFFLLPFLAEAYGRLGKFDLGFAALQQWSEVRARHPLASMDKIYQRIRGDLLLRRSSIAEAETSFRRAIDISAAESAKIEQLRATLSLARLLRDTNRRDEARAKLSEIYGWFTEGFDTADLKEAKALLDELKS
jgi:class 3 adenylate cyclase/tetratricopeptide (TPR) repeat protein